MPGRLIVFGGSFDPPHRAHVQLPRLVREKLDADAVIYVPVGIPPHRPDTLAPARHRLAMLKLALADDPHAVIDPIEIERAASGRPTYTVDTLEALREKFPGTGLRLLIGADQMRDLHTWRNPNRILELAEPVVMAREDIALPDASWSGRLVDTPRLDVSATELRRRLAVGEATGDWLDPDVARHIARHGLYRG